MELLASKYRESRKNVPSATSNVGGDYYVMIRTKINSYHISHGNYSLPA